MQDSVVLWTHTYSYLLQISHLKTHAKFQQTVAIAPRLCSALTRSCSCTLAALLLLGGLQPCDSSCHFTLRSGLDLSFVSLPASLLLSASLSSSSSLSVCPIYIISVCWHSTKFIMTWLCWMHSVWKTLMCRWQTKMHYHFLCVCSDDAPWRISSMLYYVIPLFTESQLWTGTVKAFFILICKTSEFPKLIFAYVIYCVWLCVWYMWFTTAVGGATAVVNHMYFSLVFKRSISD